LKVVLEITNHKIKSEYTLDLYATTLVGRSSRSQIQLDDKKASSSHCRLTLLKDRLEIIDLESKNGTYLNGIRIEESEVFIGDVIKVGDSTLTLLEKRMTPEAIDVLTFPGPNKERISYELRMDFTGARIQNQLYEKQTPYGYKETIHVSHVKEFELRKKAKSQIKLSKQEVLDQHKSLSLMANFLDTILILSVIGTPLVMMNSLGVPFARHGARNKLGIVLVIELVVLSIFIYLNYKRDKFTIGEKITGLKKIYTSR
jgi:hypothetical protein